MCGIAGILRVHEPGAEVPPHHEVIPEGWLDILDESIKHRGPDGAGRFRDRMTRDDGAVVDVALAHRRLSIIDHADGGQPMVHVRQPDGSGELLRPMRFVEDAIGGRPEGIGIIDLTGETCEVPQRVRTATDVVAVVFNGCIYNHRELRAELEGLGHRFETDHSDTEVLVHGWQRWGLGIGERIDGMAGVLAWDHALGQLLIGRDFVGEKPLYETKIKGDRFLIWCTSAKALACGVYPGDRTCPPRLSLGWIRNGWDLELDRLRTQVEPGCWKMTPAEPLRGGRVGLQNESFSIKSRLLPSRGTARPLCVQSASEKIEQAVRSRLEADVPLGIFLSGGLDSALLAAVAHRHHPDICAFTVRMPARQYDESDLASHTAGAIGCRHEILDCDAQPADDLVDLIRTLGLPFGDSSLLPTYWVSKSAKTAVGVAISGDGGDELFGGYQRYEVNALLNHRHEIISRIPASLFPSKNPRSFTSKAHRLIQAAKGSGYDELVSIFAYHDLQKLTDISAGRGRQNPRFWPQEDPLRRDFERYLPFDILCKTDTASMFVALEVRSPFLSRDLVKAALATPIHVLMPGGERKGLLKQVARKYLPPEIVDRPKQGFAIPIGEWFRSDYGGMRQLLYDHLESAEPFPGLGEAGVEINMDFVRRMLREHDAAGERSLNPWHGRDHSQRLYMLLVLSIWAKWLAGLRGGGDKE